VARAIVIGASIGGLTTAAVLARAGLDVTMLEAQVYPGGCASTFFHQGYRFDSGATLAAGFYPGGPMDRVAQATGIEAWPARPVDGWGGFMLYIGLDGSAIPQDSPLHHQVISRRPLGEGNSVFASLSPTWDASRAPSGHRALTLSTHTNLNDWWQLYQDDRPAYEARKAKMTEKVLTAAEAAIPGLRAAARLVMPGTPVTFQRFTRRKWGWVGGFPQTGLLRTLGPRLGRNLWLVGDSIFPGQSTTAVALGGLRVAHMALSEISVSDATFIVPQRVEGVSV